MVAKAVSDDEGGAADHQIGKSFLHKHFGFGVELGSGFIEDEDRRILQDGAGDGDALALAAAEAGAAFTDHGIVAFRQVPG